MNDLDILRQGSINVPAMVWSAEATAREHYIEFFVAGIRNANTRTAYFRATTAFLDWVHEHGLNSLHDIRAAHVASWIEGLGDAYSTATVKLNLAALKVLFDWLVVRQVLPINPAASVRSPRLVVRKGKTVAIEPSEARVLVQAIDVTRDVGLRDRALIGLMLYTFARIGAALTMRRDDVYVQNRRLWVRLHEKGGKLHDMPCHHELEEWLDAYLRCLPDEPDGSRLLFRAYDNRNGCLGTNPFAHANAYMMVRRRARQAGLAANISNHSFRATGITAYLLNGGTLEKAANMANHASTRNTQLYDRRSDSITIGEVERIRLF